MKSNFLVGVLLLFNFLVGFGQEIKAFLEPNVLGAEVRIAIIIENTSGGDLAPAESDFQARFDELIVDFSTLSFLYENPRWSSLPGYRDMELNLVNSDVFQVLIRPTASGLSVDPSASSVLKAGQRDTVAVVSMRLINPCVLAQLKYEWQSVDVFGWDKNNPDPLESSRQLVVESSPLTSQEISTGSVPVLQNIPDSAYVLSVTSTSVEFGWEPFVGASYYQVQTAINGNAPSAWVNVPLGNTTYEVNGLTNGDKVSLKFRTLVPDCKVLESAPTTVIAFDCSAGFSGLRPTSETYCTSSFKDIIEANADNLSGSYTFEGAGVNFGGGVWYFDPQQAGAGTHTVSMIGCYGSDTVTMPTTVLPAPCSETINETTLSVPFGQPQGIYTDCLGQVYFSEFRDKTIIKIDTFGVGLAIVGVNGDQGFLDGPDSIALIQSAVGVVTNPINNVLYFADFGNNAVRKYDPGTGLVTTLAGGGPSSTLGINANGLPGDSDNPSDYSDNRMFDGPFGLALNLTYDTLFVSDQKNNKIKAISLLDNSVATIAGTGAVGIANGDGLTVATFAKPANISVQGSNIFIADETANQVRVYNSSSKLVSTYLGDGSAGFADGDVNTQAEFEGVTDVASDGQGVLFFLEKDNCSLRRVKDDTIKTFIGDPSALPFAKCGSGSSQLSGPTAMSFYVNGFIDIVDTDNDRVVRWAIEDFLSDPNGELDSIYCLGGELDTLNVSNISGFYTSSPAGFVTDNGTHWVFDPSKGTGNVTVSFNHQVGLCQGTEDRTVYVAPIPTFELGNDTLLCAESFGVDQLEVDSTLGKYQWSFKSLSTSITTTAAADTNHTRTIDSSGTYYLTVTSEFGCEYTDSIQVNQRNEALLQIASTSGAIGLDSICFDENTLLTVTDNEPTSPGFASILWNTGEVTQSITVDTSGQYNVTIVDSLGCTATDTFELVKKVRPSVVIDVQPNNLTGIKTYAVCPRDTALLNGGNNNGDAYRWSDSTLVGGISQVSIDTLLPVTTAGKFYLEVDFADGCTGTDSVIIENYLVPVANIDTMTRLTGGPVALTKCPEDSILLKANPVAVGYSYEWKDWSDVVVSNNMDFYAQEAGNYSLKITTDNGCDVFDTIAINNFSASVNLGNDQTICQRDSYTFDAGAPYFSYLWSDNSSAQTLTVSDSGRYGVTVVTNDGCEATDSVNLEVLVPDSVTVQPSTPVTICNLDSTLLTTTLSGSSAGTYSWTDGSTGSSNYVKTAGYQVVTFTDNVTGCTSLDSTLIELIARPAFDSLTLDSTICRRDTLPLYVRSVLASDSVFIYGFNTSFNTRTLVASGLNQTTFDGVDTSDIGTYVYVADNGKCVTEFISNINVTDLKTLIVPRSDTICFGDSLLMTQTTTGGRSPYTYSWSQPLSNSGTISNSSSPSAYAIPGNPASVNKYRLRVEDAVGCYAYDTASYYYNTPVVADIENGTNFIAICGNGVDNAFDIIGVKASGGFGNYTYKWSRKPSDAGLVQFGDDFRDSVFAEILSPVPDTVPIFVRVEDSYGCFGVDSIDFGLTVMNIGVFVEHYTICPNLEDSLTILVRQAPAGSVLYNWTNPDPTNISILPTSSSRSIKMKAKKPGTYRFTARIESASTGCPADTTIFIDVKPIIATTNLDKNVAYCEGDTAVLNASGSSGTVEFTNSTVWPYSHAYQWSKVNPLESSVFVNGYDTTEIVQVTNGTPGTTTQYQLILTDSIGCMDTVLTDVMWNSSIVSQTLEDTFYVCNDDLTEIGATLASGGTGADFIYNWQRVSGEVVLPNAGGTRAEAIQNPNVYFNVDSISDTSLVHLRVIDSIGCFTDDTATVINNNLNFEINPRFNPICANFPNKLLVEFLRDSNSTGNYTYNWNDPADANDLFQDSLGTTLNTSIRSPFAITDNTQTYDLTVTDNVSGCSDTSSAEIIIYNIDAAITIDIQEKDSSVVCYLDQIVLKSDSSKGGTIFSDPVAPYIYNWYKSPSSTDNSNTTTATNGRDASIAAFGSEGNYATWILELTDKVGCKGFDSTTMYWNPEIEPQLVDDTVYVCTPDTALLSINTAASGGGTSPYEYVWTKNTGGAGILLDTIGTDVRVRSSNNDTTLFTVRMTDGVNCSATKNVVVIGVNYGIKAFASDYSVCQNINVQLGVSFVEDSIGNFSYSWSPNVEMDDATLKSPTITPTDSRTYFVSVYDSVFKCSATDSVEVQVLDLTAVASNRIGLDSIVMCADQDSLVIDGRTTFGGSPPYTFSWNTFSNPEINVVGSTTADTLVLTRGIVSPIDTTLLVLTAEDQNGCIDIDSVAVYWNSPVNATILQDSLFVCSNASSTLNAVTPTGGTGAYRYNWSVISGGVQFLSGVTANYLDVTTTDVSFVQLSVTDGLGCVGSDTTKVEGINFQITAEAQYDSICAGLADSLFVTNIINGIGGYRYAWSPNTAINDATAATPVVTPTTATEYTVTVTDSTTGCIAQDAVNITLYEFNAVAGAAGLDTLLRCYGETNNINLDASLTNGGTTPYNYLWSTADATVNFVDNASNPGVINRAAAGDGSISTIQLLATDNIGCTSVDSIKVLWNSEIVRTITPDFTSDLFGDIIAVCVGVPKTLDNLSVTGGTGNYTYSWLDPALLNDIYYVSGTRNSATPTVGANAIRKQRNLEVRITDNATSTDFCRVNQSISVNSFDVNVDLSVDEDTVCPNTQVVFTAQASNNVGFVQYSWDTSASYVNNNTYTHQVDTASLVFTAYVLDTLTGCTNFDSVNIEVRELVASTPRRFPSGDICYEQKTVMLTGEASGGKPGNYTYEWKEMPFDAVVLGTNDTIEVNPPAVGTNDLTAYQLVVADLLGCTDTVQIGLRRYDSIIVDAGIRDTVCAEGGSVVVGGSPTASYASTIGDPPNYLWSGGSFNSTISPNPRFNIPQFPTTIQLRVDVTIPKTSCSNFDTVTIEVKELPIADLSDEATFICADSSLVLHANSTDLNYVYPLTTTFDWRKQGIATRLNANPYSDSLEVTSGGLYSVLVTNEFGCERSDAIVLDSVVAPLIWARPIDTLECTNRAIILTIDSLKPARSGELFGDTIRWEKLAGFGYIEDITAQSTVYVPVPSDNFVEIKVTYKNQCGIGRDIISATIAEAPQAFINVNDSTINITESAVFDATSSINYTGNELLYQWTFGAPDIENEFFEGPFEKHYNPEGTYPTELVITDKDTKCTDTARVNIYVNGTHLLYVPNVFSPNASNPENRTLKMYGFGVSDDDFIFTVYNRWGEKVYEQTSFSQAISVGWEGTYKNSGEQLDMGVYTYIVRARYVDGTPIEKVGTITLLR